MTTIAIQFTNVADASLGALLGRLDAAGFISASIDTIKGEVWTKVKSPREIAEFGARLAMSGLKPRNQSKPIGMEVMGAGA
jgi:hypothetical protein